MKQAIFSVAIAAALFTSGCAYKPLEIQVPTANRTFVVYEVQFNARAGGPSSGVLETFSNNRNCTVPPGKSRRGCVTFEENTFGSIVLRLRNEPGDRCTDNGVRWVITKVEATVTVDLADDNKGSNWGAALPTWVTDAFAPIQDAATGLLLETDVASATTAVVFRNENNNDPADPKLLLYRVTASSCDGDDPPKISDPRIENKGLN